MIIRSHFEGRRMSPFSENVSGDPKFFVASEGVDALPFDPYYFPASCLGLLVEDLVKISSKDQVFVRVSGGFSFLGQ